MREMFRQIFSAVTRVFETIEHSANALNNYAKWAEDESGAFVQEAAIEREARIKQLTKDLGVLKKPSAKTAPKKLAAVA